jgi:hypothetical protein
MRGLVMNLSRIRRPRYADVVATLALFLAMGGTAYAATVGTSDIQNGAVTTPKLASEAVTSSKLAPNSVTGGRVLNNSLTVADLKGIDMKGPISYTFSPHVCAKITLGVTGAVVGQLVLVSWTGAVPTHLVFGPWKVVSSTQIIGYGCNMSGSTLIGSNVGVRVITFG